MVAPSPSHSSVVAFVYIFCSIGNSVYGSLFDPNDIVNQNNDISNHFKVSPSPIIHVSRNNRDLWKLHTGAGTVPAPAEPIAVVIGTEENGNEIDDNNKDDNGGPPPEIEKAKASNPITCKDSAGNPVTWWIVYKLPKIPDSKDAHLKEGSAHYILLPDSTLSSASGWQRSSVAINDSLSIVGTTLGPLIVEAKKLASDSSSSSSSSAEGVARVLYNDQPPDAPATIRDGHTKGVIFANSLGGLWMPHSIPHFPKVTGKSFSLDYPPGGLENGQMLVCMSMTLGQLDEVVGGLLGYTKATYYNSSIPLSLQNNLKNMVDAVLGKKTAKSPPYYTAFTLPLPGLKLRVFAKGPKFHREIFADWLAPEYNSSLDVQSWMTGSHPFHSNCSGGNSSAQVFNIVEKQMLGQNFSHTNDHSKWAVGTTSPLTCIADLNRMKPQKGRGGVAVCMEDVKIWNAFKSLVIETEPCNVTTTTTHVAVVLPNSGNVAQNKNNSQVLSYLSPSRFSPGKGKWKRITHFKKHQFNI